MDEDEEADDGGDMDFSKFMSGYGGDNDEVPNLDDMDSGSEDDDAGMISIWNVLEYIFEGIRKIYKKNKKFQLFWSWFTIIPLFKFHNWKNQNINHGKILDMPDLEDVKEEDATAKSDHDTKQTDDEPKKVENVGDSTWKIY